MLYQHTIIKYSDGTEKSDATKFLNKEHGEEYLNKCASCLISGEVNFKIINYWYTECPREHEWDYYDWYFTIKDGFLMKRE